MTMIEVAVSTAAGHDLPVRGPDKAHSEGWETVCQCLNEAGDRTTALKEAAQTNDASFLVLLVEMLDWDDRPAVVIEDDGGNRLVAGETVLANRAMNDERGLLRRLLRADIDDLDPEWRDAIHAWIAAPLTGANTADSVFHRSRWGFDWTGFPLRNKWKVLRGTRQQISPQKENRRSALSPFSSRDLSNILERTTSQPTSDEMSPVGSEQGDHESLAPAPDRHGTPTGIRLQSAVQYGNLNGSPLIYSLSVPANTAAKRRSTDDLVSNSTGQYREPLCQFDAPMSSKVVDWTRYEISPPTSYTEFFRRLDWHKTYFGPIQDWSPLLRTMVVLALADPDPVMIMWGPRLHCLYNEASVHVLGSKHPKALGQRLDGIFASSWSFIEPLTQKAMQGLGARIEDFYLPLNRHGWIEETFWNVRLMPIVGHGGRVVGLWDKYVETTDRVIAKRRMKMLVSFGEYASKAASLSDLWSATMKAFEEADTTIPFAVVYSTTPADPSMDDSGAKSTSSSPSTEETSLLCILETTMGIDRSRLAPALNLSDPNNQSLAPFLSQARKTKEPVYLRTEEGTLPEFLRLPMDDAHGFGDHCRAVAICPIALAQELDPVAFVILALNPRRPFEEHKDYIFLLSRRLVEYAASVTLPEDERRTTDAVQEAHLRQATITTSLLSRAQEAESKQSRFARIAGGAPLGMFIFNPDGTGRYMNDAFLDYMGLTREDESKSRSWEAVVADEDLETSRKNWHTLSVDKQPVIWHFRVKRRWSFVDEEGVERSGQAWLLASSYPEMASDGQVTAVIGWLMDVSHQKITEVLQKERLADALEAKRQSESFIDMVSHEIRNPLSAILQCADAVANALPQAMLGPTKGREAVESINESVQTILLCANHQCRIINDILTVSKLDANLLEVTADKTHPVAIMEHVMKMYEGELQRHDIKNTLTLQESLAQLHIKFVLLDPTRLTQILINILTNAIKFTQSESRREITVRVGASRERPTHGLQGSNFFPRRRAGAAALRIPGERPGVIPGEPVFMQFSVQDSGRGLCPEEEKRLFYRFSQASPRTHVKYGGSGLGLFISRELTELHDGQIGMRSTLGGGSTFEFYLKAWRCDSPSDDLLPVPGSNATLPVRPTSAPLPGFPSTDAPASAEELLNGPAGATLARSATLAERLHVLVVEDNIINQKVMAAQLTRLQCVVHLANHGGEALDFVLASAWGVPGPPKYDPSADLPAGTAAAPDGSERIPLSLILMDCEMPIMDGLTAVRKIRALENQGRLCGHVPVIAVTANARDAQQTEAREHGMDLVVTKPFRIPDLLPQIQDLVHQHRRRFRMHSMS